MGPKTGRRNVRKVEVPTDTPTEFELGDTATVLRREKTELREREEAEKQQRQEREEARRTETPHTVEGVAEKKTKN